MWLRTIVSRSSNLPSLHHNKIIDFNLKSKKRKKNYQPERKKRVIAMDAFQKNAFKVLLIYIFDE